MSGHAGRRRLALHSALIVLVLFLTQGTRSAWAATVQVPLDQPTIQAGIDVAGQGDTVLVAPGTYVERLVLLDKNVLVASHFLVQPADSTFIETTVIHADTLELGLADTGSVVTIAGAHDTTTALFGLTLAGGTGFLTTGGERLGGGVYSESDMALLHCRLRHNSADKGGAFAVLNAETFVVGGCRIDSNTSVIGGPLHFFRDNLGPEAILRNSIIVSNTTSPQPSVLKGGLSIDSCQIEDQSFQFVSRNRLTIKHSRLERCPLGTALLLTLEDDTLISSPVTLLDPRLIARRTFFYQSSIHGINDVPVFMDSCFLEGSLNLLGSYPVEIRRSTLISADGTAIRLVSGAKAAAATELPPALELLTLEQTLVVSADHPAIEILYSGSPILRIQCSNVFTSQTPWISQLGTPVWDTALVSFGDPRFCDPASADYRLQLSSTCLPAQSGCGLIGAFGLGCGGGMVSQLRVLDEVQDHVVSQQPVLAWSRQVLFPQSTFEIEVGSDTDWSVVEHWQPGPLAGADTFVTYGGTTLIDGDTYQARVRVSDGSYWSDWVNTAYRLNSVPAFPLALWPPADGLSDVNPPRFLSEVGQDAENDSQRLLFAVWANDSTLLDESGLVPGGAQAGDTVEWTGLALLTENERYHWSVGSSDSFEETGYGDPWRAFFIDAVPEPPTLGPPISPVDDSIAYTQSPLFQWPPASESDPLDVVGYLLQISSDSLFPDSSGLPAADTELVSPLPLPIGQRLWWRVRAQDDDGLEDTSSVGHFRVYTPGDVNGTGSLSTGDIITLVNYVFKGQPLPVPVCAGQCDGDDTINASDIIWLVNSILKNGPDAVARCD